MRGLVRAMLGPGVYRKSDEGTHTDCTGKTSYSKSQGGSLKIWGVTGFNQRGRNKRGMMFITALPPKNAKKRTVTKYSSTCGKKYKTTEKKNDNSVSMNKERFEKFVKDFLVPKCREMGFSMKKNTPTSKKPLLIMDRERCLWAKSSLKCLKRNGFRICHLYPSASPDFNVIERCWSFLKDEVYSIKKFPTNISPRTYWLKRIHNAVKVLRNAQSTEEPKYDLLSYIGWRTYKKRLNDCIKNKGGATRY